MKKLVLHIPHSSIEIPLLDGYVSSHDEIQQEIIKLTDWYTDDLFDSQVDDKIVTPFSRIFCDVERFADDDLEVMSKFGMGVLYEKFDNGNLRKGPISTVIEADETGVRVLRVGAISLAEIQAIVPGATGA